MSGHRVVPSPDTHFYTVTKYAVTALTEATRQELRAMNSQVTPFQPILSIIKIRFVQTKYHLVLLQLISSMQLVKMNNIVKKWEELQQPHSMLKILSIQWCSVLSRLQIVKSETFKCDLLFKSHKTAKLIAINPWVCRSTIWNRDNFSESLKLTYSANLKLPQPKISKLTVPIRSEKSSLIRRGIFLPRYLKHRTGTLYYETKRFVGFSSLPNNYLYDQKWTYPTHFR